MIRRLVCLALISVFLAFAVDAADEVFQYKGRVGFTAGEDKLVDHQFIDDGRKLVVIGNQLLQVWDVENGKLTSSAPHNIGQFMPRGYFSEYVLLGIPRMLDWRGYIIDPKGKWIATIEKVGTNVLHSVVVRDLTTLKTVATFETPKVSIDYMALDETTSSIMTTGETEKTGAFGTFETTNFTPTEILVIPGHKWHQKIGDGTKMLVGTGDTKVVWSGSMSKEGGLLTLRDVKTGAIEKTYSAENLKPETAFTDTIVSPDERFMISRRDGRVFAWEIAGDGKPFLEVSKTRPKSEFDLEGVVDSRFIVVFVDHELQIYDIKKGGKRVLTVAPSNPKEDLDFTSIVENRYALIRVQAQLHIFDLETGERKLAIKTDNDPKDRVELRDISDDKKLIAVADDGRVAIYAINGDGKPILEFRRDSPKERFGDVSFFNDRGLISIARRNDSEKKPPRTEFYNLTTGKLEFTAPFENLGGAKFSPDHSLFYQMRIGGVDVWNTVANTNYVVPLKTYTEQNIDPVTGQTSSGDTGNLDSVIFAPDYSYVIRHGRNLATVFEMTTGRQVQTLVDPVEVEVDKNNRVKKSGLGDVGWIRSGKLLYATEPSKLFGSQRTLSLWEVKK